MEKNNKLNEDVAMLPISAISEALEVNQRTLRIWDKENILSPKRTAKNRRHYSLNDLKKGRFLIFLLRNLALNLSGVKVIIKLLEENKVDKDNYLSYIEKIALEAGIDKKIQEENIKKTTSRGAKPKDDTKD